MINQESTTSTDQQTETSPQLSVLSELVVGWVFPIFSSTFYYHVGKRPPWRAILFIFTLATVLATLATIKLVFDLNPMRTQINEAFATGSFPEITITNGTAIIHAPEPVVIIDRNRELLILDTTGKYTRSDLLSGRYDNAILLTKTELLNLNEEGKVDAISLNDIQGLFGSKTIKVNARTVKQWLDILVLIYFILLGTWNFFGRLAYVTFVGLGVWGFVALFRRRVEFAPILITGLYATVPAIYAKLMLSQFDINFPLITLPIQFIFWIFGLVCALYPRDANIVSGFFGMRSVRVWRTMIALPLLTDFALEAIFQWKAWYVTWPLTALTFIVLIGISLPTILNAPPIDATGPFNEPIPFQPAQSALTISSSLPVKLWTPGTIGWTTFLVGFPGGMTLTIINWHKMGMKDKALIHLIVGLLGTFIFLLLLILLPSRFAELPSLLINLGFVYYFRKQMETDIASFRTTNHEMKDANGFGGFLIGLAMLAVLFLAFFLIAFLLTLVGVSLPE